MTKSNLEQHLHYLIPEMRLILLKEPGTTKNPKYVGRAADLEPFIQPLKYYSEEHFVILHLNVKSYVIGYQIIAHGTITETIIHPREVFKAALINNSFSIIAVHNHPTGNVTPSPEDLLTTRVLIEASKVLGILLLDHVIISSDSLLSLRDEYPELWTNNSKY